MNLWRDPIVHVLKKHWKYKASNDGWSVNESTERHYQQTIIRIWKTMASSTLGIPDIQVWHCTGRLVSPRGGQNCGSQDNQKLSSKYRPCKPSWRNEVHAQLVKEKKKEDFWPEINGSIRQHVLKVCPIFNQHKPSYHWCSHNTLLGDAHRCQIFDHNEQSPKIFLFIWHSLQILSKCVLTEYRALFPTLQPLSHRDNVAHLLLHYHNFHGNCSYKLHTLVPPV